MSTEHMIWFSYSDTHHMSSLENQYHLKRRKTLNNIMSPTLVIALEDPSK